MTPLDSRNYTVGCICALPVEMAAVTAMLDEEHDKPTQQDSHDQNTYTLGRIGEHNVVIACLPDGVYGTVSAATLGEQMRMSFRNIRFALMVGIGGGVPSHLHDIRLGDVVVSKPRGVDNGVIQYDYGKAIQDGELIMSGSLNKPPKVLLTAMSKLEAGHRCRGNAISDHINRMVHKYPNMRQHFRHQGIENDRLYAAGYTHIDENLCRKCDSEQLVERPPRESLTPSIFYGTIGSGNKVVKDGITRDKLASQKDILCFEMEAAGLMDTLPCLVIRGICDYADSHKNKVWQEYASATAAAYAKELLITIPAGTDAGDSDYDDFRPGERSRSNTGSSIGSISSLNRQPTFALDNMESLPPSVFELASRLYAKEDISLASLIPDRRYPDQDALVIPELPLAEYKDYSVRTDKNFSEFVKLKTKSNSGFKKAISKIFLSPAVKDVGGDVQVLAKESRIYMMNQPRAVFEELSTQPSVRDWLSNHYLNYGDDVYFVVGYRTLVNAQFVGADLKVDKKARHNRSHPGPRENYRYETTGERVYAICFRRVNIRTLRSGDVSVGTLDPSCWRVFTEDRGMQMDIDSDTEMEDDIISADLEDEDDDLEEDAFGIASTGDGGFELVCCEGCEEV
ncbi:hypothetical protein TWF481_006362 [Arthrobotrys musiformis]|uniref:Nucleoside phosphorylase domain-containing protein n=1 Tax=Arthrobotrys musiformis TaxID=47236 RepID=A0AAV9WGJ4_9PEZI